MSPLLVALTMFLVMATGAVAAFVVTRQVVEDQEHKLLEAQAEQVAILIASLVTGSEPSLRMLGAVAAAEGTEGPVFTEGATPLLGRGVQTVGVAARRDAQFVVVASVGDGPTAGEVLAPERAMLAERALSDGALVTELFRDGAGGTRLAMGVPVGETVVYQETPLAPEQPIPSSPGSPFDELRGAVYASADAERSELVLTSEEALPLTGEVAHEEFPVGADTWSLSIKAREPLVGSFARSAPWLLLGGGLFSSVLAAAVVDVLVRRRSYALALVEGRTAKLRGAQEAAEAANRSKSEFLSRMSHELRTPLNAVLGFGQLLESEDLSGQQRDAVDHILKGGRHLLELINEVLDITRIETGTISLSPEAVNVGELLNEAIDLVRPLAASADIQLAVAHGVCGEYHVLADRQRARQVLLNLLSNAIKYNRQRGTVAVSCEQGRDGRIRMNVADTGAGITPEQQERLFTPFERLGAEQSNIDGSGIGLALSRRLAEAMGGTLGVDSTPGQGSCFWFEAEAVEGPVERYERLNGDAVAAPPARSAEPRAVLYIEDNLSNLTLVERILAQRPEVEVVSAMQGRLGLELARQHDPVLILLDLHLPDIGGDEVLQRLRRDPVTASIPVVIVSADATPGQVERLLADGAAGYITKPLDVGDLLRVVDDALARRHAVSVVSEDSEEVRAPEGS